MIRKYVTWLHVQNSNRQYYMICCLHDEPEQFGLEEIIFTIAHIRTKEMDRAIQNLTDALDDLICFAASQRGEEEMEMEYA